MHTFSRAQVEVIYLRITFKVVDTDIAHLLVKICKSVTRPSIRDSVMRDVTLINLNIEM